MTSWRTQLRGRTAALGALVALCGLAFTWVTWSPKDLSPPTVLPTVRTPKPDCTFEEDFAETNAAGARVRFGRWSREDDPVAHDPAVQVGSTWLDLPDAFFGATFHSLLRSPDGHTWLALAQFDTEAAGDIELLASDDGGRTFVHQATVPWPTYVVGLSDASFDGRRVELSLELEDEAPLASEYWGPLDHLAERFNLPWASPVLTPGRYTLRSNDAGRTFGDLRRSSESH